MEFFGGEPAWLVGILIFLLRILDVSLGTMRTISVVQGHIRMSVLLGFFEVLIWITAISGVIANLDSSPLLVLAYAGGFAAGNATGIMLEQKVGWGTALVRLISPRAHDIADYFRKRGDWATCFDGEGAKGTETMLFGICQRRRLGPMLDFARKLDSELVYTVEPITVSGFPFRQPLPQATGWRARFQRK